MPPRKFAMPGLAQWALAPLVFAMASAVTTDGTTVDPPVTTEGSSVDPGTTCTRECITNTVWVTSTATTTSSSVNTETTTTVVTADTSTAPAITDTTTITVTSECGPATTVTITSCPPQCDPMTVTAVGTCTQTTTEYVCSTTTEVVTSTTTPVTTPTVTPTSTECEGTKVTETVCPDDGGPSCPEPTPICPEGDGCPCPCEPCKEDCDNCTDCTKCPDCPQCVDPPPEVDCDTCTDCTNCPDCPQCVDPPPEVDCDSCTDCESCPDCPQCVDPPPEVDCDSCTDCESCPDCPQCVDPPPEVDCDSCTDCESCPDCPQCVDPPPDNKCDTCTDCHECPECPDVCKPCVNTLEWAYWHFDWMTTNGDIQNKVDVAGLKMINPTATGQSNPVSPPFLLQMQCDDNTSGTWNLYGQEVPCAWFMIQYRGYVLAEEAGDYTITNGPKTDDLSVVWMGETAIAAYDESNSVSDARLGQDEATVTTFTVDTPQYVPIRIMCGQAGAPFTCQVDVTSPSGNSVQWYGGDCNTALPSYAPFGQEEV